MKYAVDTKLQAVQKNIHWGDFPTIGIAKNGALRAGKTLRHYYKSWEDYITNGSKLAEAIEFIRHRRQLLPGRDR